MGYVDVSSVHHTLPDGRVLLDDVSFRVGDGVKAALVGANGAGKTTLLRLIAGDLAPQRGTVVHAGGIAVMRQFIGSGGPRTNEDGGPPAKQGAAGGGVASGGPPASEGVARGGGGATTVQEFLVDLAAAPVRDAWTGVQAAEIVLMERDDEKAQLDYAHALAHWGDVGGYDIEVRWDTVTVAALGLPYERCKYRELSTLSGGEQKRLALELLLRGPEQVLLLDEPDNYLDVPGKRWLERRLRETSKTVLFVSHDRELLAQVADRVVTVEGADTWVHGGGFASYHEARSAKHERMAELRRRWEEEHARLREFVLRLREQAKISPDMASRYRAAQTRLARFEADGPPPDKPPEQRVSMRLRGGRTGVRAITCERLELSGLMRPFDGEIFFGERIGVLGANGAGKSHFLRLLAGEPIAHSGQWRLGARVVPGLFAQTHAHPQWVDSSLVDLLWTGDGERAGVDRGRAMSALRRYGLHLQGDQRFGTLSGGQQARFQILLLELSGATLLLLDEPTDNLDVLSAEALEDGLASFEGTVLAVTHDRWFARSLDRYLVFGADGTVYESSEPVFDEARVARPPVRG